MTSCASVPYYNARMAMGKRKRDRQPAMWVATTDLLTTASHPFYVRLDQLLGEYGFDDCAEAQRTKRNTRWISRPAVGVGGAWRRLAPPCTPAVVGFAGLAASDCCGDVASCSNGPSRTRMTPAAP